MSSKLFKLYFKLIFSSLIFWLYLLFISGFFCLFTASIGITGGEYSFLLLNTFAYLEVAVAIFSFCLAVYFIRQRDTLEKVCLIPETKCRVIKVTALIIASSIICLLPLIYCSVIAVSQQVGFSYCFMTIVFYCAKWLAIIVLMETMGSLLGYIVKSPFIYLLVLPIVIICSFLNQDFFGALRLVSIIPEWIKTLISIQNMYVEALNIDYAVPRLNLLFLNKLIAMLAFSALLLYLLYFAVSKKRRTSQTVCMLVLIAVCGLTAFGYSSLFPTEYSTEDKLYYDKDKASTYAVTSCKGEITLSEFCKFDCTVTISNNGSGEPLYLHLDRSLKPKKVLCGSKALEYRREGDYLIIEDERVSEKEESEINIVYSGRINYINNISVVDIFASTYYAALPPNFAFLPMIDGDCGEKTYDLSVKAKNTVISNLFVENSSSDIYHLSGTSDTVCMFEGFFSERTKNGTTYYSAKYGAIGGDLEKEYESSMTFDHWNYKTMNLTDEAYPSPNKVFQIYYYYDTGGFPTLYGDYMMVHHFAKY